MIVKIDSYKVKHIIIYILLFFATMNFQAKFFYFIFAILVTLIIGWKKIAVNQMTIFYLMLGVLFALYNYDEGIYAALRCVAYVTLYLIGYNLMIDSDKTLYVDGAQSIRKKEREIYCLLIIISSGAFIHYLLNYSSNYGLNIGRNTVDIWSGEIMAATGQATLACLMLAMAVAMIVAPTKKILRVVGIICVAFIMAYNLVLAGRLLIMMFFILLVIALLYVSRNTKQLEAHIKRVIYILICILIVSLLFYFNFAGIQNIVLSSNLFERIGFSFTELTDNASRSNLKALFIMNAHKYPFGGRHLHEQYGYAHDLLLDGYDEYGILGFILLVIILVNGIKELLYLLKKIPIEIEVKVAILCIYISFLMVFCIEPILAGMQWLFCTYCLVNGCITGLIRFYNSETKL